MRRYIRITRACCIGFNIVSEKARAWAKHDLERMKIAERQEEQHMKICTECNPDLKSELLQRALWPGREVVVTR